MSLILRVGWVCTLEKYVTKFYVTNWEGRMGLNPNMYDVTVFNLFFEGFPKANLGFMGLKKVFFGPLKHKKLIFSKNMNSVI